MNFRHIEEPLLEFGIGQSVCPKDGIYNFHPYDIDQVRPAQIRLAIVGKEDGIEKITKWLNETKKFIDAKESKRPKSKLFPSFPGFNNSSAFKSEIVYDETYLRSIRNSEFENVLSNSKNFKELMEQIIELYLTEIKFLSKNKVADIVICVLSEKYVKNYFESGDEDKPSSDQEPEDVDNAEDEEDDNISKLEMDFRRMLKAKTMKFNIPIQIVRDRIGKPTSDMQDKATIAWNLYTALYYKSGGTPWGMRKNTTSIDCYAGISFYRSRDQKTLQTSIAQIFNEVGKGVILRGEPIEVSSKDRIPHLTENQAFTLMDRALKEYKESLKIYPQRLVIHKTSNYNEDEIVGFKRAADNHDVHSVDMVTILDRSGIRLYREGMFAPRRGSHLSLDEKNHILYTRGSVEFYETYPGKYPPSPIHVRLFKYDSSPNKICEEVLALTKMNWNNTQFDRKFPITIECARKVGEILKYLNDDEKEQMKYSFYM